MPTKIEWATESWNPVTGCDKISAGCKHCYAERMARRLAGRFGYPEYPNHFDIVLHPERLKQPRYWRKSKWIFVCSMGDLFHDNVPFEFVDKVFREMRNCPQHTFLVLTKRPERMLECDMQYPVNVIAGVSVENQQAADERTSLLLQVPAVVHFASVEPMLEAVDIDENYLISCDECGNRGSTAYVDWDHNLCQRACKPDGEGSSLDWLICGAESGPGARPMDEDWVRSLRDQCIASGTSFFYKQKLVNGKKISMPELDGKVWNQYPREMMQ